jgi:DNA invertase Pin-like site-specific DNA recombinase
VGKFFFTIMAAFSQLEREQTAERTSDAMQRLQGEGRCMSKRLPYGYKVDNGDPTRMVPCEAEQDTIQRIVMFKGCGYSLRKIGAALAEDGLSPRGSKRWHPSVISGILARAKEK